MDESIFNTLNKVDVSDKIERKNGLSYLSWAYAWGEVKKLYPYATYTIYERDSQFGPVNYFTDGKTCWVKTGVKIGELEHIEELPIMDYKNKSILLTNVTSFDVNKAIQRSLTKALARHGLGLYIYAGEDLPEDSETSKKKSEVEEQQNDKNSIQQLLKQHQKLVNTMDEKEIDFREKLEPLIFKNTGLTTQNITELDDESLKNLCAFYKALINKFDSQQAGK
ncbi:MAG: DUF1071 domain-containing protein [Beduini sp.]|uniref:Sak single strand annealing protein n=1 Tax=Beduini sp. TaxID=1922300 RepID=UPI00399EF4F1